ncbi:MAG: hypothetical protein KGL35_20935 [Bradyrhizobium sp.]|nr:hypothetical protein [Bradyrhizobium sp.]
MLAMILAFLGHLLGGPFAAAAVDAYKAKLTAENSADKIAADLAAQQAQIDLERQKLESQLVIADEGRWWTAAIRPLFALPFIIYLWKVLVWDRVLFHSFTYDLTAQQTTLLMVVVGSYFGHGAVATASRAWSRR